MIDPRTLKFGLVWMNGAFVASIDQMEGRNGVYVLRSRRSQRIWYVGESHTGRMRKTFLRHFMHQWNGDRAGQLFTASMVDAAVVFTEDGEQAQELERFLIVELQPLYNDRGKAPPMTDDDEAEEDAIPF